MLIPDNMRVIDLTVGQFRQILREERNQFSFVQSEVLTHSDEPHIETVPIEKLCELTGWSKSSVYKKCSLRLIPHHKVGKELRFNMDEINKWIKNKKRKTGDELVNEFDSRQKSIMKKVR
jgi:excisionase family DNA binding protein